MANLEHVLRPLKVLYRFWSGFSFVVIVTICCVWQHLFESVRELGNNFLATAAVICVELFATAIKIKSKYFPN